MKIAIPHIHKMEGEMGIWAEITKKHQIKELRIKTLEGLRQIEGILIGRRVFEVPIVVSRICGICPVVHILNTCCAIEKAMDIKVSETTILLRKLFMTAQMIQSHTLHLFFLSLADFFKIDNDLELMKKYPKETKAALKIRDFSLKMSNDIGGRVVHPLTPVVGGFSKMPDKEDFRKLLGDFEENYEAAGVLINLFKSLDYPDFKRETNFVSTFLPEEYPLYRAEKVVVNGQTYSAGDFYSNEIEETLKEPPVKRVHFHGEPYMLGSIARMKNANAFLNPRASKFFEEFKKERKEVFSNIFYNLVYQAIEVLHYLEQAEKLTKEILEGEFVKEPADYKVRKGSGLSAMEAPRGTLFSYFELDESGRISNCNIITPTAQFLNNLETDLRAYLPSIVKLSEKDQERKIRSLIRVYDPCISCATH